RPCAVAAAFRHRRGGVELDSLRPRFRMATAMMRGGQAAFLDGYRGHVDAIEPVLSGWVTEVARLDTPVGFTVSIDHSHCLSVVADRPRDDVAATGLAAP